MASSNLPENILQASNEAVQKILPKKSNDRYMDAYNKFIKWRTEQNTDSLDEEVFLAYFGEASKKYAPSSLWATYSMLKSTIVCSHNVNISNYPRLLALLKRMNNGFESKRAETFSAEEIKSFLLNAPDIEYLAIKVNFVRLCAYFSRKTLTSFQAVTVLGICGACRGEELTNLMIENVIDNGTEIVVRIPDMKTKTPKVFSISGSFVDIVRRYIVLRPKKSPTKRFFILYRGGKCFGQLIGKNSIAQMPQKIALFLNLPNPERYTGHSYRRSSTTILADAGAAIETLKRHGPWPTELCKTPNIYHFNRLHPRVNWA